jgi:riboflavin synthase
MFTGIIEEIGKVLSVRHGSQSATITIKAKKILEGLKKGDSVNTDGVCLTVVSIKGEEFSADISAETLRRSNLKQLKPGSGVNLERAVRLNDRIGGHLVSGHVDGPGTIEEFVKEENSVRIRISAGADLLKYIVQKGSVAIDGISLTVAEVNESGFVVSLIPYTMNDTTLAKKMKGNQVNLECDMIGKYVEKLLKVPDQIRSSKIDMDFLKEHGY